MEQFFDQSATGPSDPTTFNFCPNCGATMTGQRGAPCTSCQFVHYHNPLPGISVLIRNENGEVLVGTRRAAPDLWCLPCGFVESNENFLEAAHREVREETGLTIRIESIINVVSNIFHSQLESLVIVLLAEPLSGAPRPGDDITAIDWITSISTPAMAFDADRYIINEYFAGGLTEIPVDPRFAQ